MMTLLGSQRNLAVKCGESSPPRSPRAARRPSQRLHRISLQRTLAGSGLATDTFKLTSSLRPDARPTVRPTARPFTEPGGISAVFGLLRLDGGALDGRVLEVMRSALAGHGGDGSSTWTGDGIGLGLELKRRDPGGPGRAAAADQPGRPAGAGQRRADRQSGASCRALGITSAQLLPDSAFILAAHERWGDDCAARLVGSFSFAIWDEAGGGCLSPGRHSAAKTVFYHQSGEFVAFATTAEGAFRVAGVPRRLSRRASPTCSCWCRRSPARACTRASAASSPVICSSGRRREVRVRRFWSPALGKPAAADRRGVRGGVHRAVRPGGGGPAAQPQPAGLLLSAGLDSTSVAAAAAPQLDKRGERLTAFTGAPRRCSCYLARRTCSWMRRRWRPGRRQVRQRRSPRRPRPGGAFLDDLDRFFDVAEMPYTGTASRVWYEGIMAAAQRRDISVLLTGKSGNYTISWPGTGLIRSLVGTGRSPPPGARPGPWRRAGGRPPSSPRSRGGGAAPAALAAAGRDQARAPQR